MNPKVLLYDIETGGVNAFKADLSYMLNFGYKWLGAKTTYCLTVDQYPGWFSTKKGINDRPILEHALKIMEEADLLVAHYGDRFDRRFLQGRCVIHNLRPPPPTKQRDTWRIARAAFAFGSNRLGALANMLHLPEQKQAKNWDHFPGWWLRAMAGDTTAIRAMSEYCKQDVRTLEQVYLRLRPYDNPHPHMVLDRSLCPLDGGVVDYRGFAYVGVNRYRRFVCKTCGRWGRERKAAA